MAFKHDYVQAVTRARAALGDAVFEVACAEGAKLSADDVLDLVLRAMEKL